MKKYLFIVLLVGVCFGQVVSDTLVMKSGTMRLGKFYGQDDDHIQFKFKKSTETVVINNSEVKEIRLNTKKSIIIEPKKNKSVAVSDNLHYAGYHLKKHHEYFINSLLWSLAGAYLLIESAESDLPPTLGQICYLGSFYNIWKMAQSIDKAGKQLSEASKTMEFNEKNNRK